MTLFHRPPRTHATFLGLIAAAIVALNGCIVTATGRPPGSQVAAPQDATPSGPPVLGIDWGRAASIERPANFEETVSPTYVSVHPILRVPGQATMADVLPLPDGGYVSVGYSPPEWTPLAWTSADGQSWRIHLLGDDAFTFPESLASGADGTVVAVGRSGRLPVAWTTRDGETWQRHDVPILGTGATPERMTTVVAGARGFVAGGSVGPELSDRHARIWRSADGATWERVPDDAAAFADAEVRSIASFDGGLVAVGVVGNVQHPTGAVAWVSNDGGTWTRIDDPSFVGGVAVSAIAAPFGGLVAVGSTLDRGEAIVWRSADGRSWTRAEGGTGFRDPGFVWMTDVVAVDDIVIAIGDYQPNQRGTAVSWTSRDGESWTRAAPAPVQEQAEFSAIARGGPGAIAVGVFGLPDSFVPTVWLTPAR